MQSKQLSVIAEKVGISRTAVSMAINHCPGVNDELRAVILDEASKHDVFGKPRLDCRVYVIIPEIPTFFWKRLFGLLHSELKLHSVKAKFNIYSRLGNSEIVERYLDEADRMNVDVLIIAAKYEGLDRRLEKLTKKCAVFSLCETVEANNVFYFGSNRSADGALLANHCLERLPEINNYLLLGNDRERSESFGMIMKNAGKRCFEASIGYERLAAAAAREIYSLYEKHRFDSVICFDGFASKISISLKKCRIDVPIFGFELRKIEKRYGAPVSTVCQNLELIANETAKAAAGFLNGRIYPESKRTYIESELFCF